MTPERAKEILQLGYKTSEYRKHMTREEIELIYDVWDGSEESPSYYEVLKRIAAGQIE